MEKYKIKNLLQKLFCRILGGGVMVNMSKETAMKPIERIANYLKYGFAITEHQYMDCPRCGHTLNAGSNYQPKYCAQCGQRVSFKGIIWKEDRHLGYVERRDDLEQIENRVV